MYASRAQGRDPKDQGPLLPCTASHVSSGAGCLRTTGKTLEQWMQGSKRKGARPLGLRGLLRFALFALLGFGTVALQALRSATDALF